MPKSIKKTELADRRDLRERTVVTVDGEDAKDLDDAVYVQQISSHEFLLGVYIADVSYYVTEDSILDKEARERGTSVYLVDRVLPMLPERLSNGICSLNAGEDRLAMACEMHIDRQGTVLNYEIFPAVPSNIIRGCWLCAGPTVFSAWRILVRLFSGLPCCRTLRRKLPHFR